MYRAVIMNKIISVIFLAAVTISISGCGDKKISNSLLVVVSSKYDINKTIGEFHGSLQSKDSNYTVGETIKHQEIAKENNIYLKPTLSVTINNPLVMSALLTCNPSMAMEFPLHVSVYTELNGEVKLAFTNPEYWTLKHNIKDKNCIEIITKMSRDFDTARDKIEIK